MKTSPITFSDLQRSVIAVPPLARNADFSVNESANRSLIRHMESGGIRSLMYGGNANFYHLAVSEYAAVVDFLADAAGEQTWVLPSIGPDYGKMVDQAALLRQRKFPTAMLLPVAFPFTEEGLAIGIRRISDALGKPLVLYVKQHNYIRPDTLAALIDEGRLVAVKYAVVVEHPETDDYLRALLAEVDSNYIVSGIGERPAIVHMRDFGLSSFTTGSGCVAPAGAMALLQLLKERRYDEAVPVRARFIPLEDARDAISPIRVLHDAVTLAGIADMGPMLPLLTGLSPDQREQLAIVARALLASDASTTAVAA